LLDEVHEKLALDVSPVMWPAGSGQRFRGVVDLRTDEFITFHRPVAGETDFVESERVPMASNAIVRVLPEELREETLETSKLAREALPTFDIESYREGHMTPVFFGSALRRFGVSELLGGLAKYAPSPRPQKAHVRETETKVPAVGGEVSGFVF